MPAKNLEMKTEMVTKAEIVRVSYWTCPDPTHHHQSEAIAIKCIAKHKKQAERNQIPRIRWTPSEHLRLLTLYRAGASKADLARQEGLSRGRIAEVIKRAEKREKEYACSNADDPFTGLSTGTRNALWQEGLRTVDEIQRELSPIARRKVHGIGKRRIKEIWAWLNKFQRSYMCKVALQSKE